MDSRRLFRPFLLVALLVLGLAGTGCSGGGQRVSDPAETLSPDKKSTGTLGVRLVGNGEAPAYSEINLVIQGLEARVDGIWVEVAMDPPPLETSSSTRPPLNLLACTSEAPGILATKATFPAGTVDALRFTLGKGAKVVVKEKDSEDPLDLKTPAQWVTTLGLPGAALLKKDGHLDLVAAFDLGDLVVLDRQPVPSKDGTGGSGSSSGTGDPEMMDVYVLAPGPIRAYDKALTGTLEGKLVRKPAGEGEEPQPLAGARVTAQILKDLGSGVRGMVMRSVLTDDDGSFRLDLLPLQQTWCVMSQALVDGKCYPAVAAGIFQLGSAPADSRKVGTLTADAPILLTGKVEGKLSDPGDASEAKTVDLLQKMALDGSALVPCVVATAAVAADGTFAADLLPPGTYWAVLNRFRYTGEGLQILTRSTEPFQVKAGEVQTLAF